MAKTKLCEDYMKGKVSHLTAGLCKNGEHCNFAHDEKDLRYTMDMYKTALCNNFNKGNCKLGERCRFAHGEQELRKYAFNYIANRPISTRNTRQAKSCIVQAKSRAKIKQGTLISFWEMVPSCRTCVSMS